MSTISIDQVKKLRDQTGVSIMQCRKALEEAGGDMEKATIILKKKSGDIAAKKSDRSAQDGIIAFKQVEGKAVAVVLNCETDFVAKNDEFIALANTIADSALTNGEQAARDQAATSVSELVQKIGENIQLGTITIVEGPIVGGYIHNAKAGAIVALSAGTPELAKDVAMHGSAMKPAFVTGADVPTDARAKAEELFKEEVAASGKPADIQAKMLEGKLNTYFKEQTLVDQMFIKDPSLTIDAYLKKNGATLVAYKPLSLI